MRVLEYLKNNILYLDGALGTLLQARGLKAGEKPELLNLERPSDIIEIHKQYYDAGSNVVSTNTFGANLLKFDEKTLEKIISSAVQNAKKAQTLTKNTGEKFIALDVGPLGKLLKPFGDLEFENAVSIFAKTVEIGARCGVDLIFIETMNDCLETKCAVLGAKSVCDLPIFVSNAYGEDGSLISSTTAEAMVAMLEGLGVSAIGANCSFGPKKLSSVLERILKVSSTPVLFKPNAGMPKIVDGETKFDVLEDEFSEEVLNLVKKGVSIIGGCCGTTPSYVAKLVEKTKNVSPLPIKDKNLTVVSSYKNAVCLDKLTIIGERINPTGKKRFRQALIENDVPFVLKEGLAQVEAGAEILDVNVGINEIEEEKVLKEIVEKLQQVVSVPLQIDTASPLALEKALRIYNGKPLINSVNGKKESMEAVFPLVKKYGGVVVALTLDENGIPDTVEGRLKIAKKIIKTAKTYGISKKDIIVDTLAMTVSAQNNAGILCLDALEAISKKLQVKTSLGVSNVSFGLPNRTILNATFFALAISKGLNVAIINPFSVEMMNVFKASKALLCQDENCQEYLAYATKEQTKSEAIAPKTQENLSFAIEKGLKDLAKIKCQELLKEKEPLKIINEDIIPSLDRVGKAFEEKKVFLPSLLMSAESAKEAFEIIKSQIPKNEGKKEKIVLATVKGDIHDIGKNIAKLLFENYGYQVIDLGKDVPCEKIVETVKNKNARFLGLSALMTTTAPEMKKIIDEIKAQNLDCKVIVGGAVLTEEYAKKIGASFFSKDALSAIRFVEKNS